MKKLLLLTALFSPVFLYAQQGIDGDNIRPVKLADVIRSYHEGAAALPADPEEKETKYLPEGRDYHFDRWLWYWQQHTDQDGYLVSPAKTWQEWQRYNRENGQLKTTANSADWNFIGPSTSQSGYSGIGRINAMEFHPSNANTLWVGSAGGGVWTTTNNGGSWTCLTDKLPVLSVSDIDVNKMNTNTLYLCTGDRDSRDHYSIGVLKSVDGGNSWNSTGLSWNASQFRLANCLLINPGDTASLTLATSEGIYKSFDAGASWNMVQPGNFKQVLYHPYDTAIMYATSFYTKDNLTPAQIFRSKDGGNSWQQVTNFTGSWRITLAVTPGDVKYVKAIVASYDLASYRGLKGFYSSSDTGKNFSLLFNGNNCTLNILSNNMYGNGCTGQGNYDLAIAVSPTNPNDVYVGGVNTWHSYDGGYNWQIVNQWYSSLPSVAEVHADKHFLGFHPLNPARLFECNDGGIYWTANPQSTIWNDISNGLAITQFYRNAVSNTANYVIGGAQDNGSKSITATITDDVTGGDGMDCQIDPVNPNTFYTGVQYGKIYRNDPWPTVISDNIPGQPTGAWITPYLINPQNNNELFAGYQDIYYSPDQGDNWTSITQGPLVAGKNLLRLGMTPAGPTTLYAVPDSSNQVFYTHNINTVNPTAFTLLTPPFTGRISDIQVDAHSKDHFWITYSGFGSPQVVEYKSGNWTQMNTNLPDLPIWCIEADSANGILYVGTDAGVFYLDTVNKQWEPYNTNLPAVHVCDLGINYATSEIWGATYGRGMWKSVKQSYGLGINIIPYAADALRIYPNPASKQFSIESKAFAGKKTTVTLTDYTGKTTWQGPSTFDKNGNTNVAIGSVPIGTYIVEVADSGNIKCRQKLVIY
jgi:photosystem II stability/assembly factor-like uncharacterized protein